MAGRQVSVRVLITVAETAAGRLKMPFDQLIPRAFTSGGIRMYSPSASGVYGISNAREWIYIGQTDDIQGALLAQLADLDTSLMKREPTGFVFEECESADRPARQDRLILEYEPFCNRRSSFLRPGDHA
jgi:hypothetical protein